MRISILKMLVYSFLFWKYIYINFSNINKNIIEKEDIYLKILECNWDFVYNLIEENYKLYMILEMKTKVLINGLKWENPWMSWPLANVSCAHNRARKAL
jgi:hypothetical protein